MCFGYKKATYVTKEQKNMKIEKAMKEPETIVPLIVPFIYFLYQITLVSECLRSNKKNNCTNAKR